MRSGWHKHSRSGCKIARVPKSNTKYWLDKLERNAARDVLRRRELRKAGWKTLVIWECQIPSIAVQEKRIKRFLEE
jgi:DNA mismatch endonuclease (patch repair protein)